MWINRDSWPFLHQPGVFHSKMGELPSFCILFLGRNASNSGELYEKRKNGGEVQKRMEINAAIQWKSSEHIKDFVLKEWRAREWRWVMIYLWNLWSNQSKLQTATLTGYSRFKENFYIIGCYKLYVLSVMLPSNQASQTWPWKSFADGFFPIQARLYL